jgi:hypothetical protein
MQNLTGTIGHLTDTYEVIYTIFDLLLLTAKTLKKIHPISLNCWDASEYVYNYFYDIFAVKNGLNPKNYITNLVYNFGHIFDSLRDVYLFLV